MRAVGEYARASALRTPRSLEPRGEVLTRVEVEFQVGGREQKGSACATWSIPVDIPCWELVSTRTCAPKMCVTCGLLEG